MTDKRHTCPRRAETGHDNPDSPFHGSGTNLDTWTTGHGLATQGSVGASCSYCGSLNPDRFMELVRDGWTVGPTDKSYKAYLHPTPSAEDIAAAKTHWLEYDAMARAIRELGEENARTPEQITADLDKHWDECEKTVHIGSTQAKFYFQHLSPEQREEFIELHNVRRMKIGAPGYFYVRPFFTGPGAE